MRRTPAPLARSRSDTDAARSRAKTPDTREREEQSVLQAMADNSPQVVHLSHLADSLNGSPRQVGQRAMAERISGASVAPFHAPIQRVTGSKGLDAIKAAIHEGRGKAAPIANDIYGAEVGAAHDGDFETNTVAKIITSAKRLGYGTDEATRLANRRPFARSDINENTEIGQQAEDYLLSSFSELYLPFGDEGTKHKLRFENTFRNDGTVVFKQNFRNAALASFHASDVIEVQRDRLHDRLRAEKRTPPAVTRLVRENVISVTGQEWFAANRIAMGPLAQDRLESFLGTENGKSSQRVADAMGKSIVRGEVSGTPQNWSVTLHLQARGADRQATLPVAGMDLSNSRSEGNLANHMATGAALATTSASASAIGTASDPRIESAQTRLTGLIRQLEQKDPDWKASARLTMSKAAIERLGSLLSSMKSEQSSDGLNSYGEMFERDFARAQRTVQLEI